MKLFQKFVCTRILFCFIIINGLPLKGAAKYYRTVQSGSWKDTAVWETAEDALFTINFANAFSPPDNLANTIVIREGHTIIIDQSVTIDETIVERGAFFIYGNTVSSIITINDGPGIDLQVFGTIEDSGPFSINWNNTQASWTLGPKGTMIRTRSTSAALWRDHYNAGMSTIPDSSNWIIRKQSADNPTISSVNSYYGNLSVENWTTSFWNANTVGSKVTGVTSAPMIKGTMEIGVSGTSGVKFYSQNSAFLLLCIMGDFRIGQNSIFQLENAPGTFGATGVELHGNLYVDGTLAYDESDASDQNRFLMFSGTNNQYISGEGSLFIYNFKNNKSSGTLFLNRSISIDNTLTLLNGEINLNGNSITLTNNSFDAMKRANGWIKSEDASCLSKICWNIGTAAGSYLFPFGKDREQYIPFSLVPRGGDLGTVSISTYGTAQDNLPFPVAPEVVTNLNLNGKNNSAQTVDRFWQVYQTGTSGTADLIFSFSRDELPSITTSLEARHYNADINVWEAFSCCQQYDPIHNQVMVQNAPLSFSWTFMEENEPLYLKGFGNHTVPIEDKSFEDVAIFPIPCNDRVSVLNRMQKDKLIYVEIVNGFGQIVFSEYIPLSKVEKYVELDLSMVQDRGSLFFKLVGERSVKTIKVVRY
ncbi:MAG TPA: hypothetical protein VK766_10830 [Cytophagaceae bacterium]|jgi:hypothetical protein|nr:hypothetical protein [Cytophagaceae bacterium]